MIRHTIVTVLILFAGCGERPVYAGCHQRVRRVAVVQKQYYAPVAALVQPIYYSVGEDLRRQALVEAVTTRVLEQENARLRQQLQIQQQQAQQQYQPQYAPQRYAAPQRQEAAESPEGQWIVEGGVTVRKGAAGQWPGGIVPKPPPGMPDGTVITPVPGPPTPEPPEPQPSDLNAQVGAFFRQSCIKCHNQTRNEAGVDLSGDPARLDPLTAHRAVFQVLIGKMPKQPVARATEEESQLLVDWLDARTAGGQ